MIAHDEISVLTAAGDFCMAKYWLADGTIAGYDLAKNFKHRTAPLDGIRSVSALLKAIEPDRRSLIIRGRLRADAEDRLCTIEGRIPGHVLRRKEFFEDQPLHLLMCDIDEFTPTAGDPLTDPIACIDEFVRKRLPDCFQGAAYYWQHSGSAGSPKHHGKLKAHVWYWLDTPRTSAELAAWCESIGNPIDKKVFATIQAHYTSAPQFAPGVVDPVKVRSGLMEGWLGDRVRLDIPAEVLGSAAQVESPHDLISDDPVAQRLHERGMVKSARSDGSLFVACPFEDQHSDGKTGATACIYFPPHTGRFAQGNFKCQHAHCVDRKQPEFRKALGIDVRSTLTPTYDFGFDNVVSAEDVDVSSPATDEQASDSDVEIARQLARLLREHNFKFEHGGRGWLVYRKGLYIACRTGEEIELAKRLGPSIAKSASANPVEFKRAMKLAQRAMSAAGINAALQLAQSDPLLATRPEEFDADPDLFNASNGVLHLPTCELRPHSPDLLLSKQCPFPYEPGAKAPVFERFLSQISSRTGEPDPDWVEYLQRAIGYSLSGRVNEEMMFFLLGVGANGKSVFCNVMQRMFGSYSASVPANFLMVSKRDGEAASPALASLQGARLALANEVEAGSRISAQMVKVATSVDRIAARHLYGQQFVFAPTHALWVRGNHKPIIADNDEGIWRRIHLIPFERHFKPEEKDVGLEEKIMGEAPGVVAWMVRGHVAYRRQGLRPARRVAAASAAYRKESDLVGQWIDDCAAVGAEFTWVQGGAYQTYRYWCSTQGLQPMAKKSFTVALSERGFSADQETTGARHRVYLGLQDRAYSETEPAPQGLNYLNFFAGSAAAVGSSAQDAQDSVLFSMSSA